jgi:hypothetical protein
VKSALHKFARFHCLGQAVNQSPDNDALGLSTAAGEALADARTGKNGRNALVGMLRQSVFGRLAGYEDVNDAVRPAERKTRLSRRPAAQKPAPIAETGSPLPSPPALRTGRRQAVVQMLHR